MRGLLQELYSEDEGRKSKAGAPAAYRMKSGSQLAKGREPFIQFALLLGIGFGQFGNWVIENQNLEPNSSCCQIS